MSSSDWVYFQYVQLSIWICEMKVNPLQVCCSFWPAVNKSNCLLICWTHTYIELYLPVLLYRLSCRSHIVPLLSSHSKPEIKVQFVSLISSARNLAQGNHLSIFWDCCPAMKRFFKHFSNLNTKTAAMKKRYIWTLSGAFM